jgi:hypothetical protein
LRAHGFRKKSDALTGYLDLGQLGLTELPTELFGLKHLRRLNLGSGMFGEHEQGVMPPPRSRLISSTPELLTYPVYLVSWRCRFGAQH